jgi:probable rRNA maturation factor
VRSTQRKFPVDFERIKEETYEIQKVLGVEDFQVDVWFCSEAKIREMNADWRDKSKSTDVLSFPACEFVEPGVMDMDDPALEFEKHLGDIVIAPAYVDRVRLRDQEDHWLSAQDEGEEGEEEEWEDAGVSKVLAGTFGLQDRYRLLIVHSLVHLVGYDHETPDEWRAMTAKEDEVLRAIGLLPADAGNGK